MTRLPRHVWLIACLLWLLALPAAAASPVIFVPDGTPVPLSEQLDFMPDTPDILRERLIAGEYDTRFRHFHGKTVDPGTGSIWLRIELLNASSSDRLILSLGTMLFAEAEFLYGTNPGQVRADNRGPMAGLNLSAAENRWPFHDTAFLLALAPDEKTTVYFRVASPYYLLLAPYVAEETVYSALQYQQGTLGFLIGGLMLGVFFYLITLSFYVRQLPEVGYCIAFVGVSLLVLLYSRGYLLGLLPDSPWLKLHLYPILFSTHAYTYLAFSRRHFHTQLDFPNINLLLRTLEYCSAALLPISLVVPIHWSALGIVTLGFISMVVICVSSVYIWGNSQRHLGIYVCGTLVFLLVCMVTTAENLGLLEMGGQSQTLYLLALCLQNIMFSIAMGENLKEFQEQQTEQAIQSAALQAEQQAKGTFLAKMSHELRTPMNGLLGMLQLLEQTSLNDQQKHYAQVMRNSGRMLLSVIDDVIDYSRIIAGKLPMEEHDFNLTEMLGDIQAMFAEPARQKKLALRFTMSLYEPVYLSGDVVRLRQVIINLVSNAIKFTETGTVTVRTWVEKPGDGKWILHGEVEDTGIGMTIEQAKHLFTDRPVSQDSRHHGGSGLGLVISNQLVQLMGGSLHVETAPGYGSLFSFFVRVNPPSGHDDTRDTPSALDRPPVRKPQILVAEDDVASRDIIVNLLHRLGYQSECVQNGEDVVARACSADTPWLMILMDLQMPVLDGVNAARRIRAWENRENRNATPIVAVTAHPDEYNEDQARLSGMDDYLSKPVNADALAALLSKWITPSLARHAGARPTPPDSLPQRNTP